MRSIEVEDRQSEGYRCVDDVLSRGSERRCQSPDQGGNRAVFAEY